MDSFWILAAKTWTKASKEGVLAVDRHGKIILLNERLKELLRLAIVPETIDELFAEVGEGVPELYALLASEDSATRTQWGNLVVQRYPPQRLTWQQVPLFEAEQVVGSITIFRDAATQGQFEVAKQSFLSMISHDLRTPLSTILGFAELLYNNRGNLSADEQAEFLEHIIKNANQLSQYTQIALDIMFLEANLQKLDVETVVLDRFVEQWLADALHRFSDHQVNYTSNGVEKSPIAPLVSFSPAALHKILYILVEFALAESPEDGRVNLRLMYDEDQAHVVVQLQAPGLTETDAALMFQLMHPRDLSESGRPRLHRMQLYVASLLAQRQKGYLTLHALEDRQYQIDLALPLANSD